MTAFDADETGTKTFEATGVFVAGILIDGSFSTKFSFKRFNRQTIGLNATIATAFTHQLIDHHANGRINHGAALAATALFSSACLVINNDSTTFYFAQFTLNGIEFITMMDQHTFSQSNAVVLFGFICDHFDHDGTFCTHALCNLNNAVPFSAFSDTLTTRHGNRIVVQNFVGDVDASSNTLADGQDAAVKISAIANVGKNMVFVAEMLLANPRRSLSAHLRKANGAAVHPHAHKVAANARHGTRAFWNFCAGVVGTTRAEPRHAVCRWIENQTVLCALLGVDGLQQRINACQHIRG